MTFLEAFLLTLVFVFILHLWLRRPRCIECQAEASPHVSLALIRTHHRLEKVERALRTLYEENADYITINNLGPIHHNRSMKMAREALRGSLNGDERTP